MTAAKKEKFSFDPWNITEQGFSPADLQENESVFTLGNGCLGFRGNLEELETEGASTMNGTYLNGFFETQPIGYGESAYGYAKNSETICRVADSKQITLAADGETLRMGKSDLREHCRRLDMKNGILQRKFRWHTRSGCMLDISFERLVSLKREHTAAVRLQVCAVHGRCALTVTSGVCQIAPPPVDLDDPRVAQNTKPLAISGKNAHSGGTCSIIEHTENTKLAAACVVRHAWGEKLAELQPQLTDSGAFNSWQVELAAGECAFLEKYIAYAWGAEGEESNLPETAEKEAEAARQAGFSALKEEQFAYLTRFWDAVGIELEGDDATLQGLRFNLFHLLQSCGKDGKTNIAAKGLTGQGYEGHYFWDTEAYIFPFFLYTQPETAKKLLEYRYSILPKARRRARVVGHKTGALFPWRTIDGEECSAYYPAGTAQYHINGDIAYAVGNYVAVTRDMDFLALYGAELLAETARLWLDLGFYNPAKGGAFCLNEVTGPDEYNTLVNNNVYTNLMAKHNLLAAADALSWLEQNRPAQYRALCGKIKLEQTEPGEWRAAGEALYLPYTEATCLIPQDDAFFSRKPWPLSEIPQENFPLLLHYHPLVIYRHQVCKQADLILAMVLLGEHFTPAQKKENFHFYDSITTHDSSLSMAVFHILACEIGEYETAYRYFEATARLDLDNMHQNTKDGLHMANMAGTWLCLAQGFGGLKLKGQKLHLAPYLPPQWRSYAFRLRYQNRVIQVQTGQSGVTVALLAGDPLELFLYGEAFYLENTITAVKKREEEGKDKK